MTKLPFPYDLSIITKSINDGLDIDGIDEELKLNLLHNASLNGKIECVKLLIEAGAKLNVKCELLGFTPLHYSCFYDHFEITNLLLEAGSDRNITCQMNGYTPFHYAFGIYGQAAAEIFKPPEPAFDDDTDLFRCDCVSMPEGREDLIREGYIPTDKDFYENPLLKSKTLIDFISLQQEKIFETKEVVVLDTNGDSYALHYFDTEYVSDTLPIMEWNIQEALIQEYPDKFQVDRKFRILIQAENNQLIPTDKITPIILNYFLKNKSPIVINLV